MAFSFIPVPVSLAKNERSIVGAFENTIRKTKMDLGTHRNSFGDSVSCDVDVTKYIDGENVALLLNFLNEMGAKTWFSEFPDPTRPDMDHSKCYLFSLRKNDYFPALVVDGFYTITLELDWHYRVPPIDRV